MLLKVAKTKTCVMHKDNKASILVSAFDGERRGGALQCIVTSFHSLQRMTADSYAVCTVQAVMTRDIVPLSLTTTSNASIGNSFCKCKTCKNEFKHNT